MTKEQARIIFKKGLTPCGKYVIKVEGKIVWEGKNPLEKFPSIAGENAGKNLSICWKRDREILLV